MINLATAISIEINVKETFELNEETYFEYSLNSNITQEITYIAQIVCPNAPQALLEKKVLRLNPKEIFNSTYSSFTVDKSIEPQTCKAIISIIKPITLDQTKEFKIVSDPSFSFKIFSYKNANYTKKSKVFILGENIYLDFQSEIKNPEINAELIYPDNTKTKISLPKIIKAEQTGTYSLEVSAAKSGFKENKQKTQFGVIPKKAEIQKANLSALKNEQEQKETTKETNPITGKITTENEKAELVVLFGILIVFGSIIQYRKK